MEKHGQESLKISTYLSFGTTRRRNLKRLDWVPKANGHGEPNVGHLPRHEGDHVQPHYRRPFALMSGRKDGLFLIALAAGHCLLILWLSAALPASYANVGGCGIQNGNASSNHTPSATQSELQRKSAQPYSEVRETCPYFAILHRQAGLQRTDCSAENGITVPVFLRGAHAQSGFEEGVRRMECDHKPGLRPQRVDFCNHLGWGDNWDRDARLLSCRGRVFSACGQIETVNYRLRNRCY